MKIHYSIALAGGMILTLAGCSGGSSNSGTPTTNTTSTSSSPLAQAEVYSQKKVDVSSLNQAVQQYNAAEGHYPATLQDLVPNYVRSIPQAPAGYTFNYDANNGSVTMVRQ